jgi:hypothetical protein
VAEGVLGGEEGGGTHWADAEVRQAERLLDQVLAGADAAILRAASHRPQDLSRQPAAAHSPAHQACLLNRASEGRVRISA